MKVVGRLFLFLVSVAFTCAVVAVSRAPSGDGVPDNSRSMLYPSRENVVGNVVVGSAADAEGRDRRKQRGRARRRLLPNQVMGVRVPNAKKEERQRYREAVKASREDDPFDVPYGQNAEDLEFAGGSVFGGGVGDGSSSRLSELNHLNRRGGEETRGGRTRGESRARSRATPVPENSRFSGGAAGLLAVDRANELSRERSSQLVRDERIRERAAARARRAADRNSDLTVRQSASPEAPSEQLHPWRSDMRGGDAVDSRTSLPGTAGREEGINAVGFGRGVAGVDTVSESSSVVFSSAGLRVPTAADIAQNGNRSDRNAQGTRSDLEGSTRGNRKKRGDDNNPAARQEQGLGERFEGAHPSTEQMRSTDTLRPLTAQQARSRNGRRQPPGAPQPPPSVASDGTRLNAADGSGSYLETYDSYTSPMHFEKDDLTVGVGGGGGDGGDDGARRPLSGPVYRRLLQGDDWVYPYSETYPEGPAVEPLVEALPDGTFEFPEGAVVVGTEEEALQMAQKLGESYGENTNLFSEEDFDFDSADFGDDDSFEETTPTPSRAQVGRRLQAARVTVKPQDVTLGAVLDFARTEDGEMAILEFLDRMGRPTSAETLSLSLADPQVRDQIYRALQFSQMRRKFADLMNSAKFGSSIKQREGVAVVQ